jgi:hypothetical protein
LRCHRFGRPRETHNVAAAVLWRKPQTQPGGDLKETKSAARNFYIMMLAITGQWVTEAIVVLCLFGAACIGARNHRRGGR